LQGGAVAASILPFESPPRTSCPPAAGSHGSLGLHDGSTNPTPRTRRLGAVSFLNAKPLIAGLAAEPGVELVLDVPSRLPGLLSRGRVDAALVPVVDWLRNREAWRIVSDACIGCDGETLTVRVFSRVAPAAIRRLHVDGDSHTSVALARVLWQELYGQRLALTRFTGRETVEECEAVLLIGDKVVTQRLIDYETQIDLGSAWKSLTTMPFVFAVWAARWDSDDAGLDALLSAARDRGVKSADMLAEDFGPGMGWPVALAQRYLTSRLKFTLGPRQIEAMERFSELVHRHDALAPLPEPATT
jgi:chorismate dehydratase